MPCFIYLGVGGGGGLNVPQSSISFLILKVCQLTMGICFNRYKIIGHFHSRGQRLC